MTNETRGSPGYFCTSLCMEQSYHVTFLSHVFSDNKFDISVKKKAYLSLSGCKQPNGTKIIIPAAGPASAKFFFPFGPLVQNMKILQQMDDNGHLSDDNTKFDNKVQVSLN